MSASLVGTLHVPEQLVELRKIINDLIVSFGSEPGQLLSTGAIPVTRVGQDVIQLDTFSVGNGTELAFNMDSTHDELRDKNLRQAPADIMNLELTTMSKYMKEMELPSEFNRNQFSSDYMYGLLNKLIDAIMRSYEADAVLTMLKAGLMPRPEERKQLHAKTFGRGNYAKTQEDLVSPWERHMRVHRSIVPSHLVVPSGLSFAGFTTKSILQTVGFKGGNCDALIRKVSIAQRFIMPRDVDSITVYDISKDKFVRLNRGVFRSRITGDKDTFDAEETNPNKRKLDPVSHVSDFYRRNPTPRYPAGAKPRLLILQPNVEFLMASGILFKGGMLTAGFVHSGVEPKTYGDMTKTMLRVEAHGKTFVTDPRGILTMEDICFVKYIAGGGTQIAANADAIFTEDMETRRDLMVIPVPDGYGDNTDLDYTEISINGREPIRHYQGLQLDTDNQKVTKPRGHLREGASIPGARDVMDGYKYHFDEVKNYDDLFKLVQ